MALPITISADFVVPLGGPFKSGTSFYIVAKPPSSNGLRVFKADSDDPSSGWTAQDTAGESIGTPISLHAVLVGSTIHVVSQDGANDVDYYTFSTSSNTWTLIDEVVTTAPDSSIDFCSIGVRSDGDVVVAYHGEQQTNMGTGYDRIDLARREGGTWTTDISVDNLGKTETHMRYPYLVMSANDRAHIFYHDVTGTGLHYSTYLSGNTWGHQHTEPDTTSGPGSSFHPVAIRFDDGGTEKIRCMYHDPTSGNDTSIVGFNDADNPGSSISIATSIINWVGTTFSGSALAVDDATDTQFALASEPGTEDSIHFNETGSGDDTWGTASVELDTSPNNPTIYSANVYDNGGTVLAYLYLNDSNYQYNERTLASTTDTVSFNDITAGAPVIDTITLTQTHDLVFNDVTAGAPTVDTITLTQLHDLSFNDIQAQVPTIDTLTVSVTHVLAFNDIQAQSPTIDTITLTQDHSLAFNNVQAQAPTIDALVFTQLHDLAFNDIQAQPPTIDTLTVNETNILAFNNIETGAPTIDALVFTQLHDFSFNNITTGVPVVDTLTLSQDHIIAFSDIQAQAPVIDTLNFSETNDLTFDNVTAGAPTIDNLTLTQTHVLVAEDIQAQAPTIGNITLTQEHDLSFNDITTGAPTIDTLTVSEVSGTDVLSFNDVVAGAPTIDQITFTQLHDLSFVDLSAGAPTIDQITLNQVHVLAVDDIQAQAPTIDNVTLTQTHDLTIEDVIAGAPTIDTLTVSVISNLSFEAVTAGAPVLDAMLLTQDHLLGFEDVTAGAPTIAALNMSEVGGGITPARNNLGLGLWIGIGQ